MSATSGHFNSVCCRQAIQQNQMDSVTNGVNNMRGSNPMGVLRTNMLGCHLMGGLRTNLLGCNPMGVLRTN